MNRKGYNLIEITVALLLIAVMYSAIIPRIFNMGGEEISRNAVTVTLVDKYENTSSTVVNGALVRRHNHHIIYEYNKEEYTEQVEEEDYYRATIDKKTIKDLVTYKDKDGKRKYILEEHK